MSISRAIDFDSLPFAPGDIYPQATEAELRQQLARWGTQFIDPVTLDLLLSFHAFVVRTPRHVILVDTCVGADKERLARPAWHLRSGPFLANLAACGVAPDQVDFVLCTHLHADHVGWNTRLVDGRWVPTFRNAQYLIAEREYDYWRGRYAQAPDTPLNYGSFADSVLPIVESGQAVMVPSTYEVEPGVALEPAPGHTPGNLVIHIRDGVDHAVLCGDVLHHPIQIAYPEWSTRFCSDPRQSAMTRQDLLRRYCDSGTCILSAHFRTPTIGRVVSDGKGGCDFLFGVDGSR